jgi:hypothetical protein
LRELLGQPDNRSALIQRLGQVHDFDGTATERLDE